MGDHLPGSNPSWDGRRQLVDDQHGTPLGPCGPWSLKGPRLGFSCRDATLFSSGPAVANLCLYPNVRLSSPFLHDPPMIAVPTLMMDIV
jgi:hypothetical protein